MALDYALVIPGRASAEELWPRLYAPAHTPPKPRVRKGVWTADERERFGYIITLHRGRHGYYAIGDWLREPDEYLHVGFRQDRDHDWSAQQLAHNLLDLVQNVLDSGDEDLWLSFNGEELILERTRGQVRRLPAGFWNNVEE